MTDPQRAQNAPGEQLQDNGGAETEADRLQAQAQQNLPQGDQQAPQDTGEKRGPDA